MTKQEELRGTCLKLAERIWNVEREYSLDLELQQVLTTLEPGLKSQYEYTFQELFDLKNKFTDLARKFYAPSID